MADTTYTPAITSVSVSPNPASVGGSVKIAVSVIDVAITPSTFVWYCGEIGCGEV